MRATSHNFGIDAKADIALAFVVCFEQRVAGEGIGEDMALRQEVVEPSAALDGVESGFEESDSARFTFLCLFLDAANVFAIAGIVHQWIVWMSAQASG